jgi:TM2 domain-containing membrane protein YozV
VCEHGPAAPGSGTVDAVSQQPSLRIGFAEREAAVRELGEHYAAGRLDAAEYEERTSAAYAARTAGDLEPLFADLPREQPTVVLAAAPTVAVPAGHDPEAPYGRDPVTGRPYSDRLKVIAALLQLFLPFGTGRFYTGHTGIAVAQLVLVVFGVGVVWSFIDGIVLLAGDPTDPDGRPLRP